MAGSEADDPDLLVALLARHALPCPICGYDVRSLERPVCPECGARLRLRLGSPDLRVHHLIAGIVGLALGLGFNANVGAILVVLLIRGAAPGPGTARAAAYAAVTSMVLLVLLVATVRGRRAFLAWPGRRQRAASVAFIVLSASAATGMIAMLVAHVF